MHLRNAKGEVLTGPEGTEYAAGLVIVDGEEPVIDSDTFARLRALRSTVGRAVERHAELVSRSQALGQKIAALELRYQKLTGQSLETRYATAVSKSEGSIGIQGATRLISIRLETAPAYSISADPNAPYVTP